jgi:tRNA G26 N,N-dimethylase Trm1
MAKIQIRENNLPNKKELNVLDVYHGAGEIWNTIKKRNKDKNIKVFGMDKLKYENEKMSVKGDSVRYLKSIDLNKFDIIDIDCYGIPYNAIQALFDRNIKKKIIFYTFIKQRAINHKMLEQLGYTETMLKKCHALFMQNGYVKFKNYLGLHNVNEIKYYHKGNKYYGKFQI